MQSPRHPSLYQPSTRVWLTNLSRTLDRPATLDDIPDAELDRLAEMGGDWVFTTCSAMSFTNATGTTCNREGFTSMWPWRCDPFEMSLA
jgi:hypothetical protein